MKWFADRWSETSTKVGISGLITTWAGVWAASVLASPNLSEVVAGAITASCPFVVMVLFPENPTQAKS